MPVKAEADEKGNWTVAVESEPPWVSVIDRRRQEDREPVARGIWVFVAFSVWKVPDYDLVAETLRLVPPDGSVQLRVFGYDYADELDDVFPFDSISHPDRPILSHYSENGRRVLTITGYSTASPIWM